MLVNRFIDILQGYFIGTGANHPSANEVTMKVIGKWIALIPMN